MRHFFFCLLMLLCLTDVHAGRKKIKIVTSKGTIIVELYNETPLHRDNMLKLVKQKFYDSILFHRVIDGFMIQAGDPDSKQAIAGKVYGAGGLNYKIAAEIRSDLFHGRGALAAARDNNPEKASSSCQFYIVQGKVFSEKDLAFNHPNMPEHQKKIYMSEGGAPHLDGNYTVFGRVIKGMEVVDLIARVNRDKYNRPLEDIRILRMRKLRRFLFF